MSADKYVTKLRLNKEKKRMQDLIHCLGLTVYTEYKDNCKSEKDPLLRNIAECERIIELYENQLKGKKS